MRKTGSHVTLRTHTTQGIQRIQYSLPFLSIILDGTIFARIIRVYTMQHVVGLKLEIRLNYRDFNFSSLVLQ
jgi:hypothetical protein